MPPIHPDVVHFAIALVLFAFAADVVGFFRHNASALTIGWWSLVWGSVGAIVTAAAGFVDMNRAHLSPASDALVDLHWRTGVVAVVLIFGALLWRWRLRRVEASARPIGFLIYFAIVCAVVSFQGWFGGEIAYAHGGGVAAAGQGMVDPARAARRTDPVVEVLHRVPGFAPDERPPAAPEPRR